MNLKAQRVVLLLGNDAALSYLISRFAERGGYQFSVGTQNWPAKAIAELNPVVIIFPSIVYLDAAQNLITELAGLDAPIMVCSAIADEKKARELGADYCLHHPITFDAFQSALTNASTSKRA